MATAAMADRRSRARCATIHVEAKTIERQAKLRLTVVIGSQFESIGSQLNMCTLTQPTRNTQTQLADHRKLHRNAFEYSYFSVITTFIEPTALSISQSQSKLKVACLNKTYVDDHRYRQYMSRGSVSIACNTFAQASLTVSGSSASTLMVFSILSLVRL